MIEFKFTPVNFVNAHYQFFLANPKYTWRDLWARRPMTISLKQILFIKKQRWGQAYKIAFTENEFVCFSLQNLTPQELEFFAKQGLLENECQKKYNPAVEQLKSLPLSSVGVTLILCVVLLIFVFDYFFSTALNSSSTYLWLVNSSCDRECAYQILHKLFSIFTFYCALYVAWPLGLYLCHWWRKFRPPKFYQTWIAVTIESLIYSLVMGYFTAVSAQTVYQDWGSVVRLYQIFKSNF